jgi:hypothetical protein
MKDLNAPTSRIPLHPLLSIRKVFYGNRGDEHPFYCLVFCIPLYGINSPHLDGLGIILRGTQFHFRKPDIQQDVAGLARAAIRNVYFEGARRLPTCHKIPKENS